MENKTGRKMVRPPNGRVHVEFEACMALGCGIVQDKDGLVAECSDIDDAVALAAELNGDTVEREVDGVRMRMEYLNNMRRRGKGK